MNALSFFAIARHGAKPLEPFGKGSNALKAGTPDAGPEGPTAPARGRPFSPRPGSSGSAPYTRPARKGKPEWAREGGGESRDGGLGLRRRLNKLGELDGELHALADLACALIGPWRWGG